MQFDFDNGVADLVLCGVAGVFFLSIRIPPMLLRAPLACPFCLFPWSRPFVETFFGVTHVFVKTDEIIWNLPEASFPPA